MTKEQLENYKSKKSEIGELKNRRATLEDNDEFVGHSVINDYRTGYPRPQVIVGTDVDKYYSTSDRITRRIDKLSEECAEIEAWVEAIEDSLTRRIFRMYYIDGDSMFKVGCTVHMDKSTVSRKIDLFLKVATNATKATV